MQLSFIKTHTNTLLSYSCVDSRPKHIQHHSPYLLAVILLHFAVLHGFGATIATIVLTVFVIVVVIAIAVAFVLR